MTRDELKTVLPHREPMLLVDEAEVRNGTGYGKVTIRGDEFFLQGHFPGNPVVPGVILCEMMAQSTCVLLCDSVQGKTPYFTSLDKVRFKKSVRPGDTLETVSEILRRKGPFVFASARGYVAGELRVTAEFSFALMEE